MTKIRKAAPTDASAIIELYSCFQSAPVQEDHQDISLWQEKLARFQSDNKYHILVFEKDNKVVSTATLIIIENLTHNLTPYALIENVVTLPEHRQKGCASALLQHAIKLAKDSGCFKVMLMTGSKKESTLDFYCKNGFAQDKTAFQIRFR